MSSVLEPEPHHRVLHRKLKDSFTPTYLTVLSVIQGVALADLATVVVTEREHFTVVHWLLVLLTFCVLIVTLNVYMIQSTIWDWIPDVRDATIPFVFGALELFLNHAITLSLSSWLLGLAGIGILGAVGTWHMDRRAREQTESIKLLSYLRSHHLLFGLYYFGGGVLMLLLALVTHIGGIEATDGMRGVEGILAVGTVLFAGISLGGEMIISHMYWCKAIVYARTGRVPGSGKTQSNEHSTL